MIRSLMLLALLFSFQWVNAQDTWHLVFLNSRPDKPVMEKQAQDSVLALQMESLQALFDKGEVTLVGRFEGGGGVMFMKGALPSAIKTRLIQEDVAVKANFFYVEPLTYEAAGGTSPCAVRPDPANLTSLKLIRFDAKKIVGKPLKVQVEAALKGLKDQKKLLQAGWLNQGQSFFMIVRNESKSEIGLWLKTFPLSSKTGYQSQIRSWWTTKGAACELN